MITKSALKFLQAVVILRDTPGNGQPEPPKNKGVADFGWRTPAVRLVRATLQDMRVLKTALKIDGQIYHVTVYRDASRLYLDAYDPETSQVGGSCGLKIEYKGNRRGESGRFCVRGERIDVVDEAIQAVKAAEDSPDRAEPESATPNSSSSFPPDEV